MSMRTTFFIEDAPIGQGEIGVVMGFPNFQKGDVVKYDLDVYEVTRIEHTIGRYSTGGGWCHVLVFLKELP